MRRQMSARERESGELPTPILSPSDRKVRRGLDVLGPCQGKRRIPQLMCKTFNIKLLGAVLSPNVFKEVG
jgi:hypothetical protein